MSGDQDPSGNKPNLEWMYKPSALVNREDYLLGRTVDKSLKILEEAEKGNTFSYADEVEKDLTPLSIFSSQGSGPIDVIKKIKEDPLYQIQKKEEQSLKELLKNPVRMKELEERVKARQSNSSSSKKRKSKSKKEKRDKKKRRRRGSSNDSSSGSGSDSSSGEDDGDKSSNRTAKTFKDIDRLLSEKLQSLKNSQGRGGNKRRGQSSSSDSDSDGDKKRRKKRESDKDRSTSRSDSQRDRRKEDSRDHDRDRDRQKYSSSSTGSGHFRRPDDYRSSNYGRSSASTTNSSSISNRPPPRQEPQRVSKTMREEELEKKRLEMMENAKWRDEQRTKSVNKYRSEEQKEKEELEKQRDSDFIRKQLIAAAETGSVEKRIKSNSYNIQRSKFSMDQNFVRR